ncbi:MAG: type I DNA topoisomerase [Patescibacteria group bacterium]|nr:type I DNA topoisomerase [Patescibacteria group bacterium]
MKLLIVESPTKAKTISRFLGSGFNVQSSFGHLRDLPKSKMGVDVENNFAPSYVIPADKRKQVTILKKEAEKSDEIYYATDEDREGEAIAWHLAQILGDDPAKSKRITFHEITESALKEALENPHHIDMNMVDAQQARRILDRLVGYELSPFLWRKVAKGLSAGRVQSVAVRLIVEREREILAFKPEEYWTIEAMLAKIGGKGDFTARLNRIDGKTLNKLALKNKDQVLPILKDLRSADYLINDVIKKEIKRNPLPPYTTSTLQQDANRRHGFSAKQTMMLAQQLYEGVELSGRGQVGLITYMRTDSVNLAEKFIGQAKDFIQSEFGKEYLPPTTRRFKTKSKLAQEAHEAIRPTDPANRPNDVKKFLNANQYRLYDLIWRRSLASQMESAHLSQTTADISAGRFELRATGSVIDFPGFLKAYGEYSETNILPPLEKGEKLNLKELLDKQHFTEPAARYSDATLVKALEEYGIGRPSTYAPTIATIIERNYVTRDEKKRLAPTEMAFIVNDILCEHFPQIVDFKFTAEMEENLDGIAEGKKGWTPVLKEFYVPFHKNLLEKEKELTKKELTEEPTGEACEKCGKPMIKKIGRFGAFLACSGFPECRNTKPIGGESEIPATDEKCEQCGAPLVTKHGRFGAFLACSRYPDCKYIKKTQKSTGVKCPSCKEGDIISRRSKRGKIFYGCSRYPKCDFALWQRPTGEICPKCSSLIVQKNQKQVACSNKDCDFIK